MTVSTTTTTTSTTVTTLTTITLSTTTEAVLTAPSQQTQDPLDAILDDAFDDLDSNVDGSNSSATTAPAGNRGNTMETFSKDHLEEMLRVTLQEFTNQATTTSDGIPLPDTSHLALQEDLALQGGWMQELVTWLQNPSALIVALVDELVEQFKEAPNEIRGLLSQQLQGTPLPTMNDPSNPCLIVDLPSFENQEEPMQVMILVNQILPNEMCKISMEQEQIRQLLISKQAATSSSSSSSSTNVEQMVKNFNEKIESWVEQGKAKYISSEERATARAIVVSKLETTLTFLGIPKTDQAAMIQNKECEIEIVMAIINIFSREGALLEKFKQGILSQSSMLKITLQEMQDIFSNPSKIAQFFDESEASRFKQRVKDFLMQRLQSED